MNEPHYKRPDFMLSMSDLSKERIDNLMHGGSMGVQFVRVALAMDYPIPAHIRQACNDAQGFALAALEVDNDSSDFSVRADSLVGVISLIGFAVEFAVDAGYAPPPEALEALVDALEAVNESILAQYAKAEADYAEAECANIDEEWNSL